MSRRCPTRRCGRRYSKRTQTTFEEDVVHSADGQRRVRLSHGRRAGCVSPASRSRASRGVPGRSHKAFDGGGSRAPASQAGRGRAVRLRIRPQRHGHSVRCRRSPGGVARGHGHRCRTDWAHFVKELLDGRYRDVDTVTLVMDQLNTHSPASFYEAFDPAEARRLTDKLEIHYTPKHGSWLNIAEIELSALSRQCLDRRIADTEILKREVAAWKAGRNDAKTRVRWRFTTANARIKLHRLYPAIKP